MEEAMIVLVGPTNRAVPELVSEPQPPPPLVGFASDEEPEEEDDDMLDIRPD